MNNHIAEFEYKNFKIFVDQDEDAPNPRTEWDNASVMRCFHRRYRLGDKDNPYRTEDYPGWDELERAIVKAEKPIAIARLFLYDHSGLRIKIGSFQGLLPQGHAEFDSGCVGFILVTRESYEKCCSKVGKRVSAKIKKHAEEILRQDTQVYDAYLRGDCYVWHVGDDDDEYQDSCGGYYLADNERPDDEANCMVVEAKGAIDSILEDRAAKAKEESDRAQEAMSKHFELTPCS